MLDDSDDDSFLVIPRKILKPTATKEPQSTQQHNKEAATKVLNNSINDKNQSNKKSTTPKQNKNCVSPTLTRKLSNCSLSPSDVIETSIINEDVKNVSIPSKPAQSQQVKYLTEIYKNIYEFFKILNQCQTTIASKWNIADVSNGINWALLIEEVFKSIEYKIFYKSFLQKTQLIYSHWKLNMSQTFVNVEDTMRNAKWRYVTVSAHSSISYFLVFKHRIVNFRLWY